MWIQVRFWFKKKNVPQDFEDKIGLLIHKLMPYIKRKFILYEPEPHCFLALELKSRINKGFLYEIVKSNKFDVKRFEIVENTKDGDNRETFLDILNAFTDFYFFHKYDTSYYRKTKRVSIDYFAHIVHCMANLYFTSDQKELEFYDLLKQKYDRHNTHK